MGDDEKTGKGGFLSRIIAAWARVFSSNPDSAPENKDIGQARKKDEVRIDDDIYPLY